MASVTNNIYTVENKPTTLPPPPQPLFLGQTRGGGEVLQFFKKIEIIFYIEKVVGPNVLLTRGGGVSRGGGLGSFSTVTSSGISLIFHSISFLT